MHQNLYERSEGVESWFRASGASIAVHSMVQFSTAIQGLGGESRAEPGWRLPSADGDRRVSELVIASRDGSLVRLCFSSTLRFVAVLRFELCLWCGAWDAMAGESRRIITLSP